MFAVSFLSVESKVVGPIGPSTVRSIKRLVRFSRKPLSSVAPRSEFAVWRQVAASFVPRLGLSLRELSKFTISPRFPSLAHSRLSTGTSPSNGPFGPASAAARSNDPRPYVCRLVPEYYSPIRFLTPRRPEFRSRLYPHLPRRALGRCLSSRLPALSRSAGCLRVPHHLDLTFRSDDTRPPWVTRVSSPPCRPHTPWCDGVEPMRLRPNSAGSTIPHLWPTGSSSGWLPSITTRWFSSCPSDPTSRWAPCPPKFP